MNKPMDRPEYESLIEEAELFADYIAGSDRSPLTRSGAPLVRSLAQAITDLLGQLDDEGAALRAFMVESARRVSDLLGREEELRTAIEQAELLLDNDGMEDIPDALLAVEGYDYRGYSLVSREGYDNSEKAWKLLRDALSPTTTPQAQAVCARCGRTQEQHAEWEREQDSRAMGEWGPMGHRFEATTPQAQRTEP